MRLVCISDTHNLHKSAFDVYSKLPEGDILLVAGDITNVGKLIDVISFSLYFKQYNFKHRITIAGNHDYCFEDERKQEARQILQDDGWIYLENSEAEVEGIKFYGSPWTPWFHDWAFNFPEHDFDDRAGLTWSNIPGDTDVLITHGPPRGILDRVVYGNKEVGCPKLFSRIMQVKPKLHLFGHIHEAYGTKDFEGVTFCNASVCTLNYNPRNAPFVFDFDPITKVLDIPDTEI